MRALLLALAVVALAMPRAMAQPAGCEQTLAATINSSADLNFFSSAIKETGLEQALSGPGPTLVFAPSDAAFEALRTGGQQNSQALLSMDLRDLMRFHVASGEGYQSYQQGRLGAVTEVSTLCGACGSLEVTKSSSGDVINGQARATQTVPLCNGLLVVVDQILVPEMSDGDTLEGESPFGSPPAQGACSTEDPTCCDKPPPEYTCQQQLGWGKCTESWLVRGGYCKYTCGRCQGQRPSPYTPVEEEESDDTDYEYDFDTPSYTPSPPPPPPLFGGGSGGGGRGGGGRGGGGRGGGGSPRGPGGGGRDPRLSCACTRNGVSGGARVRSGCLPINAASEYSRSLGESWGRRVGQGISRYFGGDGEAYGEYFSNLWGNMASGWARQAMPDSRAEICYVADPAGCSVAVESSRFPGAAYRSC